MRNVGCLMTRKFVSDSTIYRQIKHSLDVNKVICEIYPEARYSLVGTTSILPDSLGKLVKMAKYPVVTLISHGHHLRQPFWNLHKRKIKTSTDMTQILTREDIINKSVDDINKLIKESFKYDDYRYQIENNIKIDYVDRAKNLHKPLFICPHCDVEHKMNSDKNKIWCEACGVIYEMDVYGQLKAKDVESKFTHIPDWFEWQREQIKQQIINDNYDVELEVNIDILANSTGFYRLGKGKLYHNRNGFLLIGDGFEIKKTVKSMFGVHIEYDYFGRGDGLSFSTLNETFYMYPVDQKYSITKFHFAVEELFKLDKQE
jgi:transcription elongation factor Elf1